MYSRNGSYIKTPSVVVREFQEWGHAYAYTPDEPEIHDLNIAAWLILDLCDGRPFPEIEKAYISAVAPKVGEAEARTQFHKGFDELLARNIVSAAD